MVQVDTDGNRTPLVGEVPVLVAETNTVGWARPECSPVPVGPDLQIKVVFGDNELDSDGNLLRNENFYLVNLDGTGDPVLLLDGLTHGLDHGFNDGLLQYNPSWSPQGDRIVFVSRPWAGGLPIDVEIIDVTWDDNTGELIPQEDRCCVSLIQELGEESPASPLKDTESIIRPRWSNSGDKISVDSREGNTRSIWIIPPGEPAAAAQVKFDKIEDVIRADIAWSPDDRQLVYLRNPLRGMCSEGDGKKITGTALAVGSVDPVNDRIKKDGLLCDEVVISKPGRHGLSGRYPDWWRGPSCGNGILQEYVGEQCDDGNRVDGDGCSAVCMYEP